MSKKYRIAIVGIGGIADIHARAIADQPNTILVAGSCRTEEKGRAFAKDWGCEWFDDNEKMMDVARPDVVAICSPSGAHLESALAAFKREIHVLCEKPLEIRLDRIDQMIRAAEAAKVAFGCIFPQRYNPTLRVVRDAIAAGRFGRVSVISVTVPWWRHDAYYSKDRWQGKMELDGGGALMNQGIHAVDILQWYSAAANPSPDRAANPVRQICSFTDRLSHDLPHMEVEDTAVAIMKMRGGTLGQILSATSMYPGSLWRITVSGRDGTISTVGDQITEYHFRNALPEDELVRNKFSATTQHHGGSSDPLAIPFKNHSANLADFLKAIDENKTPEIDGVEGRKAVEIVRACYDSAEKGRMVELH